MDDIRDIMLEAIMEKRPHSLEDKMLPIWNQPFFFKIDMAEAITLSYAPTDKGARVNYPELYEAYKKDHSYLTADEIYDLLYDFEKEEYWRKNFDKIISSLGIKVDHIAHMDMSSFPYKEDKYRKEAYRLGLDGPHEYVFDVIDILNDQLKFIFIDGKDNVSILNDYFKPQCSLVARTELVVNGSGRQTALEIYQHNEYNFKIIYFGTFLYGATCVSNECVNNIIDFIKQNI